MTTLTQNRRKTGRLTVPQGIEATVTFSFPAPGGAEYALPLKDLSAVGISFALRERIPGLEIGTTVRGATVRAGEREVRGQLVVMHVTPHNGAGGICGALFYGNNGRDLSAVVERLEGRG